MRSDLLDDLAVKIGGLAGYLCEEYAFEALELVCDLGNFLPRIQFVYEASEKVRVGSNAGVASGEYLHLAVSNSIGWRAETDLSVAGFGACSLLVADQASQAYKLHSLVVWLQDLLITLNPVMLLNVH